MSFFFSTQRLWGDICCLNELSWTETVHWSFLYILVQLFFFPNVFSSHWLQLFTDICRHTLSPSSSLVIHSYNFRRADWPFQQFLSCFDIRLSGAAKIKSSVACRTRHSHISRHTVNVKMHIVKNRGGGWEVTWSDKTWSSRDIWAQSKVFFWKLR